MTVLAMHQPNFLPWCGFFEKMRQADIFVLLDDVQVPRGGSYANRTRILTPAGVQWLTLPVYERGKHSYRETRFDVDAIAKIDKILEQNYSTAPFFESDKISDRFADIDILSFFNAGLIFAVAIFAGIDIAALRVQSHTGITSDKSTLALDLCKHFKADVYLSGTGAKSYNNPAQFEQNGIELRYLDCKEQPYQQLWTDEFVPGLSVIDRLFNTGTIC